ncbi:MAG: hypothetical protein SF339_23650 [Blastocatellia bacterium]|nr:hypothetical protein [Blastocatellia bacterium]
MRRFGFVGSGPVVTARRKRRAAALGLFAVLLLAPGALLHRMKESVEPVHAMADLPTIMFVTQLPMGDDFATSTGTFGNHNPATGSTPRGGDLHIRYSDGTVRALTAEAGYGLKTGEEITVRDPSVHWSGTKALFSMVIGGTKKDDYSPVFWQIYEVSGFGKGETVNIRRLPQPADSNNVSPLYGTDDRILFTSDRPHNADKLVYPQLDEYESQPSNTGIWSMSPTGGDLRVLDHAVSGDFTPIIASDGRVIFTRWDHLQRDQQNNDQGGYGAFNYASEWNVQKLTSFAEIFPEPRTSPNRAQFHGHQINLFLPWQISEDGTGMETLNHIGRHEMMPYFDSSRDGLPEFIAPQNRRTAELFLQIKEDPLRPGYFVGSNAPEFFTHGAGQIVGLFAPETANPDQMQVDYLTGPETRGFYPTGQTPPANHPGLFRSPTPLTNGGMIAVRTSSPVQDRATNGPLSSRHDFHLSVMRKQADGYWVPAERVLAAPIVRSISYWDNQTYAQLSYNGPLWELDPVEVRARPRPARHNAPLPEIETRILNEELGGQTGIDQFQRFLRSRNLAVVVSRDVTRRADRQQDVSLRIAGGGAQTIDPNASPVDLGFMQFLQADLIRGYTGFSRGGRRPIAQLMHEGLVPGGAGVPAGSVRLGSDGSMAAMVPARRALTWQMTKTSGEPVVRERYWLTFAPGEIRACTNCHGINTTDAVLRQPTPTNPPQALRDLLRWYRANFPAPLSSITSVSAASYDNALLANESIAVAFGSALATSTIAATSTLPTTLGGTTVKVKDSAGVERLAPLFFVSPTQVNYQIPPGTAAGPALVTITNSAGQQSAATSQIAAVAPGLFTANATGKGTAAALVLRIKADGSQSYEPVAVFDPVQNQLVPRPIDLGPATDQVFLILYGGGIRFRTDLTKVTARIGGLAATVAFAGAQGGFVGLDQINLRLPRTLLGRGAVEVALLVDGKAANTTSVVVK